MPAPSYLGNLARQGGQGLTFGFSDEAEALTRALLSGNLTAYRAIKDRIEKQRQAWVSANPAAAIGAETAGALVPGVIGAFVPGGQGAALSTLGRVARAMDAPVERLIARTAPRAARSLQASARGRMAVGLGDELLTGGLQSAGSAQSLASIPQETLNDALANAAASLGVRGATEAGGFAVKKYKGRRK